MKKNILFSIVFLISLIAAQTVFSQFPIYRIFPSNINQIEPLIVRHPTNPQMLFASSYTLNLAALVRNEGCYLSTNGGVNWFGYDIINDGYAQFHNGDPGPIICPDGTLVMAHFQTFSAQSNRTYSNVSTNLGANWTSPIQCFATTNEQLKSSITIDDIQSSPFYGRIYNVTAMVTNPFVIIFSKSTDKGTSWDATLNQLNYSASGRNSNGPSIAVGESGQVYVAWASTRNTSPFNELGIGFAKSTNGGGNWSLNESAYNCNGLFTSQLSPWGIRINSFPSIDIDKSGGARNGWIYIVTAEKNLAPAGTDPDVILHRSTNGGNTWSEGIRVNRDGLNNGKIQYFPAVDVDDDGGINIVYYDSRNTPTNDSVQVYVSRSQDGGNTWRDYLIAAEKFYPQPISLGGTGNQGDNISIVSGNGKLYPLWMAKYPGSSNYQIWASNINLATIGINNSECKIPEDFLLGQNYPNPFNPYTKIEYSIPKNEVVTINVYDLTGKKVASLINELKTAGNYSVIFNSSEFPSGIYFYKLIAGGHTQTKRMVLVK
jgi:hypothetical protein